MGLFEIHLRYQERYCEALSFTLVPSFLTFGPEIVYLVSEDSG